MKIAIAVVAAILGIATPAQAAGDIHAFVRDSHVKHELMEVRDGAEASDTNGATWKLGVESKAVTNESDAHDYVLTWTLTSGQADSTMVGGVFEFKGWSPQNFLMVPASVYDGNRFDIKRADIAHGVPQFISRSDHVIGRLEPGEMCERVNLSAWEGLRTVLSRILRGQLNRLGDPVRLCRLRSGASLFIATALA